MRLGAFRPEKIPHLSSLATGRIQIQEKTSDDAARELLTGQQENSEVSEDISDMFMGAKDEKGGAWL